MQTSLPESSSIDRALDIVLLAQSSREQAQHALQGWHHTSSVVNRAVFLWAAESIDLSLTVEERDVYVNQLQQTWRMPQPGMFDSRPAVHTSTLALVYAALELVKNHHHIRHLQQTLTAIRDYVYAHQLESGKLISAGDDEQVTADELLAVWPFNLFSAEDLVLVQAADEIKSQYAQLSPYWQTLYVHYLWSRSYFQEAEHLVAKLDLSGSGMARCLAQRIATHHQEHEAQGVTFAHTAVGNENRYEPLATQRMPLLPLEKQTISLPVRITADSQVLSVDVQIVSDTATLSVPMVLTDGVWMAQIQLVAGQYHYCFEAKTSEAKTDSDQFELNVARSILITRLPLVASSSVQMRFRMYDAHDQVWGDLELQRYQQGLRMVMSATQQDDGLKARNVELHAGEFVVKADDDGVQVNRRDRPIFRHTKQVPAVSLIVAPDGEILQAQLQMLATSTEAFWGFGERYNALNQAGKRIDNYVYNQYRDQGIRTYMPMPLYYSSNGYALLLETTMYSEFDLTKTPNGEPLTISVETDGTTLLDAYFFSGSVRELLPQVTQVSGKQQMLPTWALGLWMSSNNWDRQQVVDEQLALAKKTAIPATVFVLEQWSDEATYYMFNDTDYPNYQPNMVIEEAKIDFPKWGRWPNPRQMVEDVHAQGMKLILWQIPILKEYPQDRAPMLDRDKAYAIEHRYIVEQDNMQPYYIPEGWFTNALVWDPTNPDAVKWWFDKRQYLIAMGIDGFKTDGGECIFGSQLRFADGRTGKQMRNAYPNAYIGAYRRFAQQNGGITFSRAGYTGAQTMPAHWAGDERSTFGAFQRSLKAGLNASLSGVTFWGWDFAGFNGEIPTSELYLRATAMAVFTPIMQYHAESKAQFNQDRTPWNIQERTGDERVIPIFKRFADLRMNLLPYIYDEANKAVKQSLPLMRALLLDYQDDSQARECFDEYLFGSALLVAPVIQEGASGRDVYLPKGRWCNFWTGVLISGQQKLTAVPTELDEIQVYMRQDTAVLLNTADGELMSDVGNQLDSYRQPELRVFVIAGFTQVIHDYLGNRVLVEATIQADQAKVHVVSTVVGLKVKTYCAEGVSCTAVVDMEE